MSSYGHFLFGLMPLCDGYLATICPKSKSISTKPTGVYYVEYYLESKV